jgi:DNA-binding GntR family transcriptional regulator
MEKRGNLKKKVYASMKSRILSFKLKPGEKILENEIAHELGVSRTPVREALNKLEQEGLIRVFSKKGYFVSDVTAREIEELYAIRGALEALAIRTAARNARPKDWLQLKTILINQRKNRGKTSEQSAARIFKEARKFHEEIARISGNETLEQMLSTITDKISRLQWTNIFFTDRVTRSNSEHLQIVKLLIQGDLEKAVEAAERHIQHSKESLLNLLSRKKDLLYIG